MTNHLSAETSPYLLQHASNPVDWFAWGDEALEAARAQDRPIFLSIGYSACHWCHVMEHESFENADISDLMNRYFINIKVDREERPDLDQIYMNAVMALTGRGGWPMSVFLTPDLKPFYGGTYWPPTSRMGMPGFGDILEKVHDAWSNNRDQVFQGADELTEHVIAMGVPQGEPGAIAEPQLAAAMQQLLKTADRTHGGFGGAPKFPHPMDIRLLLRCWKRFNNDDALAVVHLALDKMSRGGIYDQLGGGFHRYSVDVRWLAPHFEKMLYDNALLTTAYLEAFQATGEPDYERVVRETLDYVLREMTQPEGGFYSTQDADSEEEEGKFFVWSEREIYELLGPDDERVFSVCYDVSAGGNWEGHNILNRVKTHAEAAAVLEMSEDDLSNVLERCRRKLFDVRQQRIAPSRDDKVLVSWNGLMISAMAQAAQVLDEAKYADAARNAADFILKRMSDDGGRLVHAFKDGRARFNAYLDDYACLIDGLIDLYQATFETRHLIEAVALAEHMIERFYDAGNGGFFYTSADHEQLVARNKDSQDSATPSGNGMAATALLRLGRLCERTDLEDAAVGTLELLAAQLSRFPTSAGQSLIAADFLLGPSREVVVVEGNDPGDAEELLSSIRRRFLPNTMLLRRAAGVNDADLPTPVKPLLAGKTAQAGAATVYICERGTCQAPLTNVNDIQTAFEGS